MLPLLSLKKLKRVVTDTHYLNVLEIMNRNEQQMYKDISDLTKALTKLVKILEKMAKQQL